MRQFEMHPKMKPKIEMKTLCLHTKSTKAMDIQSEKLNFIQWFSGITDLTTIQEFIAMRKEKEVDFWNELSSEDRLAIDEGLEQLDKGEYVSHESVREEIQSRFNF